MSDKKSFLPEHLIMVDCEMTGVREDRDKLLQAAFVKLKFDGKHYTEDGEPLVIYMPHDGEPENNFQKKYLAHIFKACNEATTTAEEAKAQLHEWLGDLKGQVTPVGDCVPTDIAFLKAAGIVDRPDIDDDGPIPGTFHYEFFDLNSVKAFARHLKGEKFTISGLDEENIHDALVDCRNQTIELNAFVDVLIPTLSLKDEEVVEAAAGGIDWMEVFHAYQKGEESSTPDFPEWDENNTAEHARSAEDFEKYEWVRDEHFPLGDLKIRNQDLSQPIWTEGYSKPTGDFEFNEDTMKALLSKEAKHWSREEDAFYDKWSDEYHARKYAALSTKAPPIFLVEEGGGFKIWNGRHRARAAWLRGEETIDAFVGVQGALVASVTAEGEDPDWSHLKSVKGLDALKGEMAKAAQKPYDDWSQDETGYDEMLGSGGICHLIVDEIIDVLQKHGYEATSLSLDTEVHVVTIVQTQEGIYEIDIPHRIYETGGGYTWKKIPNVTFDAGDVFIQKLTSNPEDFASYTEGSVTAGAFKELEIERMDRAEALAGEIEDLKSEGYVFTIDRKPASHADSQFIDYENDLTPEQSKRRFDVLVDKQDELVGEARFLPSLDPSKNKNVFAGYVEVQPAHRRKGLATAMYKMVEKELGFKVEPSPNQDPDGKALWNQPDRAFGASKNTAPAISWLRDELEKHGFTEDEIGYIEEAYIMGSIAKKTARPDSDMDITLISDVVDRSQAEDLSVEMLNANMGLKWEGRNLDIQVWAKDDPRIAQYDKIPLQPYQATPIAASYSQAMRSPARMVRRIKAAGEIPVEDLPPEVQPVVSDDNMVPSVKYEAVKGYETRALRCDSFQDFQELLNRVLLDVELTEDFRPSVAGILNEYRVSQGYVAL